MNTSLIVTILGNDQPGLVNQLSSIMLEHKANWTDSRMANLEGKFAGLLRVAVDSSKVDALKAALEALHTDDNGIHVLIDVVAGQTSGFDDGQQSSQVKNVVNVNVMGQDRVGIVDEITQALSRLQVNIEELHSEQQEASMAGGMLFVANLMLSLPENVSVDQVQDALEALSDQLMIDIDIK